MGTLLHLPLPPRAVRHSLSGGVRGLQGQMVPETPAMKLLSRVREPPAGSPQGDSKPTTKPPGRVRCQCPGDSARAQSEVRASGQQGRERTQCLYKPALHSSEGGDPRSLNSGCRESRAQPRPGLAGPRYDRAHQEAAGHQPALEDTPPLPIFSWGVSHPLAAALSPGLFVTPFCTLRSPRPSSLSPPVLPVSPGVPGPSPHPRGAGHTLLVPVPLQGRLALALTLHPALRRCHLPPPSAPWSGHLGLLLTSK